LRVEILTVNRSIRLLDIAIPFTGSTVSPPLIHNDAVFDFNGKAVGTSHIDFIVVQTFMRQPGHD
jgi:hypothetical protein